ncbi:hypothetical protein TNCV_556811 [Trichonephila clavipes]|uniref:Uncharacterized protein n=1 Tax=Trichonephila clavipes TaxID=2585209 RepID=A0A8X6RTF9_TRICX|nr:hypothetical protein TNCV_556811 [Trichonephila clavipes]
MCPVMSSTPSAIEDSSCRGGKHIKSVEAQSPLVDMMRKLREVEDDQQSKQKSRGMGRPGSIDPSFFVYATVMTGWLIKYSISRYQDQEKGGASSDVILVT